MILKEKERTTIEDLQTQEKSSEEKSRSVTATTMQGKSISRRLPIRR